MRCSCADLSIRDSVDVCLRVLLPPSYTCTTAAVMEHVPGRVRRMMGTALVVPVVPIAVWGLSVASNTTLLSRSLLSLVSGSMRAQRGLTLGHAGQSGAG